MSFQNLKMNLTVVVRVLRIKVTSTRGSAILQKGAYACELAFKASNEQINITAQLNHVDENQYHTNCICSTPPARFLTWPRGRPVDQEDIP